MVKLSVAIKSYNHAPYIRRCIESVLDQDFKDFEVIVTDDASTDGTPDIVREFSDPRIHLEVLPTNLGISGAMNCTIAKARGELIAILNSDDFALPGRFSEQVAYLDEHRDIDALFGIPLMVGEDGIPTGEVWPFAIAQDFSRRALLRHFFKNGNFICAPTGMVRRSAYEHVGPYDRRLITLQDFDMWIRFAAAGHNLRVLPSAFSAFRIRAGQANESAPRLDTRIRVELEFAQILPRYLELDDATIEEIFKEDFASTDRGRMKPAKWRLAQLALNCSQPGQKLFGWRTLYEAAANADDYKVLREAGSAADIFGFRNQELVSAYIRRLETKFDQDITALTDQLHNLERATRQIPPNFKRPIVNQRTPQEVEQLGRLSGDLREAINRASVPRNIALDALANTLGNMLIEACESQEVLEEYLNTLRDAALRARWERASGGSPKQAI